MTAPALSTPDTTQQVSEMRAKEKRLMFWNVVIKVINITMVFGVPPMVLFAVLVSEEERSMGAPGRPCQRCIGRQHACACWLAQGARPTPAALHTFR